MTTSPTESLTMVFVPGFFIEDGRANITDAVAFYYSFALAGALRDGRAHTEPSAIKGSCWGRWPGAGKESKTRRGRKRPWASQHARLT